jgi:hypothetical protein
MITVRVTAQRPKQKQVPNIWAQFENTLLSGS